MVVVGIGRQSWKWAGRGLERGAAWARAALSLFIPASSWCLASFYRRGN